MRTVRDPRSLDLFEDAGLTSEGQTSEVLAKVALADGALLLRGVSIGVATTLWADLQSVLQQAPLRHMTTPGGFRMSVAMSNCGSLGWISQSTGYTYSRTDPVTQRPWPDMPTSFKTLALRAAALAGFQGFVPDACLINHYEPGARLSLHQDRDERDFKHPIVSVSLGLPAVFVFGGARRNDLATRVTVGHGDVVVWGGPARLHYHGVLTLKNGHHAMTGRSRFNLTLRGAG
jgi:DNA oxidative demethylase